jgi:hypothetical protein
MSNVTASKFALISTSKISTAFPIQIDADVIEALANAIESIGFNVVPLIVRDYGDAFKPDYNLINSDYQQVSTLMALRVLRERDWIKWRNCSAVIVNPVGDSGERVERAQAIAAQLGLSRP